MHKQNRSPMRRVFAFSVALVLAFLGAGFSSLAFAQITRTDVPTGRIFLRCGLTPVGTIPELGEVGVATAFTPGEQTKVNPRLQASECGGLLGPLFGGIEIYNFGGSTNQAIASVTEGQGFAESTNVSLLGGIVRYDTLDQVGECHDYGTDARGCSSDTTVTGLYFAGERIEVPVVATFQSFHKDSIDIALGDGPCGFLTAGTFTGSLTLNRIAFDGNLATGAGKMRLIPLTLFGILTCAGHPPVTVRIENGVEVTGSTVGLGPVDSTMKVQ